MSIEQRLFDMALEHIREQKGPSTDKNGGCVYRTNDGKGCAFAPAIRSYESRLEGKNASTLLRHYRGFLHPWVVGANERLADNIQLAHDDAVIEAKYTDKDFIVAFEENMHDVSEVFDVKYRLPEENSNDS